MISTALFHRINLAKNEKRFYYLEVGSSLFDRYAVLRVWGRIGGHQCQMVTPCASAEEAQIVAGRLIRRRLRRGYRLVDPPGLAVPPALTASPGGRRHRWLRHAGQGTGRVS